MDIQTDYDTLFQTFSIKELNNALFEAISAPAEEKDHKKIKALLSAGADMHAKNVSDITPLMMALLNKDDITCNMLLNLGVNIHQTNNSNRTALMFVAASGYLTGVNILLTKGADIHAVDMNGSSAFWYAKFNMEIEMMHYLLSKMSSEERQSLIDRYVSESKILSLGNIFTFENWKKYHNFCSFLNDFNTLLENNRKKLCTILFADGLGLPHHAVMERPCSPTEKATLMPDVIKQIFALRALKSANEFPEWYALSCLEKDINFFLNWKPEEKPTPKSYGEVAFDSLTSVQNVFVASFSSIRSYVSSSTKRKRDDNDDVGPDNQKKHKPN